MIDCHTHLGSAEFDVDRDEVLARAREVGLERILVVTEGPEEAERVLALCREHDLLEPCIGLHPDRYDDEALASDEELQRTLALIRAHAGELAAVGEVGLDYWRARGEEARAAQRVALEAQARLALELDLPLNAHSRSAGRHTIEVLTALGLPRVLMHAFDGKAGHALRAHEAHGWSFSIPPSVVRSKQKQKLVRALPLGAMCLETDSPVLGPERGERNEPANIALVVTHIARVKGVDEAEVRAVTTANARALFSW